MAEIMEAAKGGELKTRIMYMVNLSFSQVNEYLSFLSKKGFLKINTKKGKKTYETTTKGILYIENYKENGRPIKHTRSNGNTNCNAVDADTRTPRFFANRF
jgi:predicted transcriptional regulator